MRIVVLCATRRGFLFLRKLFELSRDSEIIVFSFREEPWEPPFLDDIRELTLALGGQFFEAKQLGNERWISFLRSTAVDLMFAVNWRYMLPASVYRVSCLGTFVFHDSLLPKYRGFSPTVWAIINGDDQTGVSLFEIAEEVDAGNIVDQKAVTIHPASTIATVIDQVTEAYLELLERNFTRLVEGNAPRYAQDHSQATYTCKRLPEDNKIDWALPSARIHNLVRAVTKPYTGAFTFLRGKKMYVWSSGRPTDIGNYVSSVPGRVVEIRQGEGSVVVLAGEGSLLLKEVQIEGGQVVCAADVIDSLSITLV